MATPSTARRPAMTGERPPAWHGSFVALSLIWGCSFWWIELGVRWAPPGDVAFVRIALGAMFLLGVTAVTRTRLPRDPRTWGHLAVTGLLFNAVPFSLFAFGETHVSAVLAGIINAMTPLATVAVVLTVLRDEPVSRAKLASLAIGFVGVLVVIGAWRGIGSGEAIGIGACLLATVSYGLAYPYTRRHLSGRAEGPVALTTGQLLCATAMMIPVAALSGLPSGPPPLGTAAGMLGLGLLGSGLAYLLNLRVLATAGVTSASMVCYTATITAVVVGVVFLGDSLSWYEPVGAAVILLGAAVADGRLAGRRTAAPSG